MKTYIIHAIEIKADGPGTFLQFRERETDKWLAILLDSILRITYLRPIFSIIVKK